jgi:hypothetical protein
MHCSKSDMDESAKLSLRAKESDGLAIVNVTTALTPSLPALWLFS